MVRKMIQLTEEQAKGLEERAKREGVSVAELVRRGVDGVLSRPFITDEMRERAKKAVGFAHFGVPDLAERHDEYWAEAIERDHLR